MIITKLKTIRESQNLTQKELADMLCVSERTIGYWEHGGEITANNLKRLAATLRVKAAEL